MALAANEIRVDKTNFILRSNPSKPCYANCVYVDVEYIVLDSILIVLEGRTWLLVVI